MHEIIVHLLVGNLPLYSELVKTPPKGVRYVNRINKEITPYYSKSTLIKRKLALLATKFLRMPRMTYVMTSADIIHSNRGICILNRKSWVIDIDHASAFVGFDHQKWKDNWYRRIVKHFLISNYCKKIMPWSIAAMKSLLNSFPNITEIANKLEVVYPAVAPFKEKVKKEKTITLLYVASLFEDKGGLEVLKAFDILRKRYDVRLIVKADVPNYLKEKFNFKEIQYYPYKSEILPRHKLLKYFFAKSDIFVYPTYFDIFGLCLLDALAVGLPIVTTDVFAVLEIVEDGKNGFLIHSPLRWHDDRYLFNPHGDSKKNREFIVRQLVEKLSLLIESSSLRRKMGRYSRMLVEGGKFSIRKRNEKLRRIYEEASRR
jgi:glycosyltransferase involved in cell wall biosynthesis